MGGEGQAKQARQATARVLLSPDSSLASGYSVVLVWVLFSWPTADDPPPILNPSSPYSTLLRHPTLAEGQTDNPSQAPIPTSSSAACTADRIVFKRSNTASSVS